MSQGSSNPPSETPQTRPAGLPLPVSVPYVIYSILALTVLAYLAQAASIAYFGKVYHDIDWIELYAARINELIRTGQLWRFITPVFLHSSPIHLLVNLYFLYVLGSRLERHYGHTRFLALYLLAAFSGNVLSFLLTNESSYSVGASTAVMGMFAADVVFLLQNRRVLGEQFPRAMANDVFLAALTLLVGLSPRVDMYGHLGGLLGGLTFAWFGGPRWEVVGIDPVLRLVDRRELRDVLFGAGLVMLLFGILAIWGILGFRL